MAVYDITAIISSFVFFLPAYVANTGAGFFGGGAPVDRGKTLWDGRRVFGDGKTLRGTIGGVFSGTLYIVVENLYFSRPLSTNLIIAFTLAFGAIFGDLIGSFIKRRIDIGSGESAPFLDQLDFAIFALFLASFIVPLSAETVIILLLITPIGHLGMNITGFLLHKKEVPW